MDAAAAGSHSAHAFIAPQGTPTSIQTPKRTYRRWAQAEVGWGQGSEGPPLQASPTRFRGSPRTPRAAPRTPRAAHCCRGNRTTSHPCAPPRSSPSARRWVRSSATSCGRAVGVGGGGGGGGDTALCAPLPPITLSNSSPGCTRVPGSRWSRLLVSRCPPALRP